MKLNPECFGLADVDQVITATKMNRNSGAKKFDLFPLRLISELIQSHPYEQYEDEKDLDKVETSKVRFLVTQDETIYLAAEGAPSPKKDIPAHYQMTRATTLQGSQCLAAGNLGIDQKGDINFISNKSGDFEPGIPSLAWMITALLDTKSGVQLADIICIETHGSDGVMQLLYTLSEVESLVPQETRDYCASKLKHPQQKETLEDQQYSTPLSAVLGKRHSSSAKLFASKRPAPLFEAGTLSGAPR